MRIAGKIGIVLAAAAIAFAAGEGLKSVARDNLGRQTELVDGGVAFALGRSFSIDNVRSRDVQTIIKKAFFKQPVVEAPSLSEVKGRLPTVGSSRYFTDAWDLFWYLEFVQDRVGLFHAIDALVSSAFFREQARCLNDGDCRVALAGSNMNARDGDRLFGIIFQNFITPALDAYRMLAFEDAHRLATDALVLARKVDFDPTVTSPDYDRVIVLGTMLAQPAAAAGRYSPDDIAKLADYIGAYEPEVPDVTAADIAGYLKGIDRLHGGCFSEASEMFAKLARAAPTDSLSDLFGFLALRALARPFIDLALLERDGDGFRTSDCGGAVPAEALAQGFETLFSELRPAMRHPGLASDLDFYASQVRLTPERRQEISAAIEARTVAGNGDEPAEPEPETAPHAPGTVPPATRAANESAEEESSAASLAWPASGTIERSFGPGSDGIDIRVPRGMPVRAAADGMVIYAGDGIRTYGNLILLRHTDGIVTAYGHLGVMLARRGAQVAAGEKIATSGTDEATGRAQLHFQVRRDAVAVDPMPYLASSSPDTFRGVLDGFVALFSPAPATVTATPAPQAAPPPAPADGAIDGLAELDCDFIRSIKSGLKAFGNDGLDIDCSHSPRFMTAVREFNMLFALNGDITQTIDKMHEIGLID